LIVVGRLPVTVMVMGACTHGQAPPENATKPQYLADLESRRGAALESRDPCLGDTGLVSQSPLAQTGSSSSRTECAAERLEQ
jgi:hypothetical protein